MSCIIIDKEVILQVIADLRSRKNIIYHKYGPHYLRFNYITFKYLSKFTKWIKGDYKVKSCIDEFLCLFNNLTTY